MASDAGPVTERSMSLEGAKKDPYSRRRRRATVRGGYQCVSRAVWWTQILSLLGVMPMCFVPELSDVARLFEMSAVAHIKTVVVHRATPDSSPDQAPDRAQH